MVARTTPANAVPAMTALLTHPSANVPLGGRSEGVPEDGPGEGPGDAPGGVGAGDGTWLGDGEGTARAGAGTGVGDGDGGVTTGVALGLAVGETVGVAVGASWAMHEVVKIAISIKDFNIVKEVIFNAFCLERNDSKVVGETVEIRNVFILCK